MKVIRTNNVEVKIYNSKKAMRRAIRKIGYNCDYTEAMVIPCTAYDCSDKDGNDCVKLPLCAELYIHSKASMPVLVHETLHAATTVIRSKNRSLNLGRSIHKREELLAYTQTAILQDILDNFFPKNNSSYNLKDMDFWVNGSVNASKK